MAEVALLASSPRPIIPLGSGICPSQGPGSPGRVSAAPLPGWHQDLGLQPRSPPCSPSITNVWVLKRALWAFSLNNQPSSDFLILTSWPSSARPATPVSVTGPASRGQRPVAVTLDPTLRKALCVVWCSPVAVLKLSVIESLNWCFVSKICGEQRRNAEERKKLYIFVLFNGTIFPAFCIRGLPFLFCTRPHKLHTHSLPLETWEDHFHGHHSILKTAVDTCYGSS